MKKHHVQIIILVALVIVLAVILSVWKKPPVEAPTYLSEQSNAPSGAEQVSQMASSTQNSHSVPTSVTRPVATPSSDVGSVFVPPRKIIDLPLYYDMSSTTDTIRVASPSQGSGASSPLEVAGSARGNWFFEGSFPVVLVNSEGVILARGAVASQSNWQTTDFVPFSGRLTFAKQLTNSTGYIYFLNDNPSGMASTAIAAVEPIVFQ